MSLPIFEFILDVGVLDLTVDGEFSGLGQKFVYSLRKLIFIARSKPLHQRALLFGLHNPLSIFAEASDVVCRDKIGILS